MIRRSLFHHIPVLAGAAALISVVASCGVGGDEGLTQAEFLKQGNQVCAESNARINAAAGGVSAGPDGAPDEAGAAQFGDVLVEEVRKQIDGLDALVPPAELKDDVDKIIGVANEEYDAMVAAIKSDPVAFLTSDENSFAKSQPLNAAIGLTDCAG